MVIMQSTGQLQWIMIKHWRRLCGIIMQSTGDLHGKHWRMGRLCGNYAKHWTMITIKHWRRCGIIMQSTGHLNGKHWRMGGV